MPSLVYCAVFAWLWLVWDSVRLFPCEYENIWSTLFYQTPRIGLLLSVLWAIERAVIVYTGVNSVLTFRYDSTCLVDRIPHSVFFMTAVVVFVQLTIWGMTLLKGYTISSRSNPIIRLVVRDGAIVFAFVRLCAYSDAQYVRRLHIPTFQPSLSYSLSRSRDSSQTDKRISQGCRVILNIQSLKVEESQPTAENGMGTWCLETTFDALDDVSTRWSQPSDSGGSAT
ncbi:hypothetical protein Hypma_005947 [Hypsizygus marmoreus]|uniref:Uncharacterized protein n=1 Tax=Hypsizygus marmoreus TaxID=39966 RepID=A0A369KDH6_HYPMA|nr:hypothetical protein Hypma_005947 [Hypsizygus marmoreus]